MHTSKNLPIKNIDKNNIELEWSELIHTIKQSFFISLDLEMSGLGDRKKLNASAVDARYKNIVEIASHYSILSLGLSCFILNKDLKLNVEENSSFSNKNRVAFMNKTFDLLTLCSESFMVEPDSIRFLLDHGFDLNYHFSNGIPYFKGNDKQNENSKKCYVRELMYEITRSAIPIVLHNGFIDLIFLYQNFYADCPDNLMKFVADLSDMFRGGIYDTKYVADFFIQPRASFLEYLYKLSLYENTEKKKCLNSSHIFLFAESFSSNSSNCFILSDCEINFFLSEQETNDQLKLNEKEICQTFATYGYCSSNRNCAKLHDVDEILKLELAKKNKRKKQRVEPQIEAQVEAPIEAPIEAQVEARRGTRDTHYQERLNTDYESNNRIHNAGLDAFMTGYIMLNYVNKLSKFKLSENLAATAFSDQNSQVKLDSLEQFDYLKFNVYITGKDYPLMIKKSNFTSYSRNHLNKQKRDM